MSGDLKTAAEGCARGIVERRYNSNHPDYAWLIEDYGVIIQKAMEQYATQHARVTLGDCVRFTAKIARMEDEMRRPENEMLLQNWQYYVENARLLREGRTLRDELAAVKECLQGALAKEIEPFAGDARLRRSIGSSHWACPSCRGKIKWLEDRDESCEHMLCINEECWRYKARQIIDK